MDTKGPQCEVGPDLSCWHPESWACLALLVPWDCHTGGSAAECVATWERASNWRTWFFFLCIERERDKKQSPPGGRLTVSHCTFLVQTGSLGQFALVVNCPICEAFTQEVLSYLIFFSPWDSLRAHTAWKPSVLSNLLLLQIPSTLPGAPRGWPLNPAWIGPLVLGPLGRVGWETAARNTEWKERKTGISMPLVSSLKTNC